MELTLKQEEAIKLAVARYIAKEKYTVISGYAGTGKSETVKYIISALNFKPEDVAYIAYTGKAAKVLSEKGCPNAMTAHKLLYKSVLMPNGMYHFIPQHPLDRNYKCIVVDEVSMLPKEMWDLLMTHNIYTIAMGDPEQLPPINPEENNHVLDHPHIFLTEIMRQAYDSEIIRLATHIREGNLLIDYVGTDSECKILNRNDLTDGMLVWSDIVLCATNKTRTTINRFIREINGYGEEPEPGDKIISLRNHWDIVTNDEEQIPLTNGTILTIDQYRRQNISVPKYIYENRTISLMITEATTDEGNPFKGLIIDYNSIKTGKKTLNGRQEYLMKNSKTLMDPPLEFAYGYCITTHKAQGSQWPRVMIIEENFPNVPDEHRRWLYTAITRAEQKIVILKK